MIIISLFGGLGNQMFQYATGKAVALRLNTELQLDVSLLNDRTYRKDFTYRNFELGIFKIQDKIADIQKVREFAPDLWNATEWVKQAYKIKRLINGNHLYSERKKFYYEPQIESIADNTYLYGYFQTEKYFSYYLTEIRAQFQLEHEPNQMNKRIIDVMKSENSVSVHVRRGDYLLAPFNLLTAENYYRKAIEYILEKVEQPKFYIFTNDIEWTMAEFEQFDIDKAFISNNQGDSSYMDMVLMSNCQHNICANSSFSWWGAWLNSNRDKIVTAPKVWFKNSVSGNNELIPPSWIKI
jgi:hypothetical protein